MFFSHSPKVVRHQSLRLAALTGPSHGSTLTWHLRMKIALDVSRKYQVYREGTHLMIPWFERLIVDDVRARPNLVESSSGSHDLQMLLVRKFEKY
ncbi:hypothetical protein ACSBR2_001309 [Camellia fascicularis]